MKLELKHLAPYLPYSLKCLNQHLPDTELVVEELIGVSNHITWSGIFNARHGSNHTPICGVKPILRPLSDLNYKPFRNYDYLVNQKLYSMQEYEFIFSNHFDVFGLIDKGLAIDINTIKE